MDDVGEPTTHCANRYVLENTATLGSLSNQSTSMMGLYNQTTGAYTLVEKQDGKCEVRHSVHAKGACLYSGQTVLVELGVLDSSNLSSLVKVGPTPCEGEAPCTLWTCVDCVNPYGAVTTANVVIESASGALVSIHYTFKN